MKSRAYIISRILYCTKLNTAVVHESCNQPPHPPRLMEKWPWQIINRFIVCGRDLLPPRAAPVGGAWCIVTGRRTNGAGAGRHGEANGRKTEAALGREERGGWGGCTEGDWKCVRARACVRARQTAPRRKSGSRSERAGAERGGAAETGEPHLLTCIFWRPRRTHR